MDETFRIYERRIRSIDVIRGIAVIGMIYNHFGHALVNTAVLSPLTISILFPGIWGQGLFYGFVGVTTAMVDHRYRTKGVKEIAIWKRLLPRAGMILLMGYLLSIMMSGWRGVLDWSVLQLIAVSMVVSQLAMRVPSRYRIALPVLVVAMTPVLQLWLNYDAVIAAPYQPPQNLLEHLSAMIATGKLPLFPWIAAPLIGTHIGETVVAPSQQPLKLTKTSLVAGAVQLLCLPPLVFLAGDTLTQSPLTIGYFLMVNGLSLFIVAGVVTTVDLWRWRWSPIPEFCEMNGQIMLITYIGHMLYCPLLLSHTLGFIQNLEVVGFFLAVIGYFIISMIFAWFWLPYRRRHSSRVDYAATFILLAIGVTWRFVFAYLGIWSF
ncbi:MAG: heparan-alpha-glucosaminide N-acetyltransferase domain-containing protein [Promethearchaeota archaeon]